jgi:hypothetical protein
MSDPYLLAGRIGDLLIQRTCRFPDRASDYQITGCQILL